MKAALDIMQLSRLQFGSAPLMMMDGSMAFAQVLGFNADRPALCAVFHPLGLLLGVGVAVLAASGDAGHRSI